jgi:polyphosphate kinase 2
MSEIKLNDSTFDFDLDNPKLPVKIKDNAFSSGGYPYETRMKRKDYESKLHDLQLELIKVQNWMDEKNQRVIIVFEGRDAAGKGGTIANFKMNMNPRRARTVALSKPTETEQGQWYYQRYVDHFPTAGEMVMFDRSWYNRAGVEPVMGFCKPEQHQAFLEQTPAFEKMLVDEGIHFFKIWLNVGQEMQLKRFHDRRHNPLKIWKLSPIDIKALGKWNDYTKMRNLMLEHTHTAHAPWTIIRSNDKRRARIAAIQEVLLKLDYTGRDLAKIGTIDPDILGHGMDAITGNGE